MDQQKDKHEQEAEVAKTESSRRNEESRYDEKEIKATKLASDLAILMKEVEKKDKMLVIIRAKVMDAQKQKRDCDVTKEKLKFDFEDVD